MSMQREGERDGSGTIRGGHKAITHKHEVGHVNIYVAIDYYLDELFKQLSYLT